MSGSALLAATSLCLLSFGPAEAAGPPPVPAAALFVQLVSYPTEAPAADLARKFSDPAGSVARGTKDNKVVYRVRLGPLATRNRAEVVRNWARQLGFADAFILSDPIPVGATGR